jgi:hypothetical protein
VRTDAVRDEDVERAWRGSPASRALLDEITGAPVTALRAGRTGRGSRRTIVLLAAVLALAAIGGGAVAAGVFDPDPADVATVTELAKEAAEVHGPGWRPELNAEQVLCMYGKRQVDGLRTMASSGPLDAALTKADLFGECSRGAGTTKLDQSRMTLCTGPSGGDGRAVLPVVLARGGDCRAAGFDPADEAALLTDVNRRRQVELTILAAQPVGRCVPEAELRQLVKARIEATREPLDLIDTEDKGKCWRIQALFWETDDVMIGPDEAPAP